MSGWKLLEVFEPKSFVSTRLETNLGVVELAKRSGVSRETIRMWERGKTRPSAALYRKVFVVICDSWEAS